MRSSLVVRASDCQFRSRNSPGFDPSILRHSGIWGAADEAVFNTVHREKIQKIPLLNSCGWGVYQLLAHLPATRKVPWSVLSIYPGLFVVYNIVVDESMSVVGAPACHKEGPKFDSKPNTQDSSWCIVVDEMYTCLFLAHLTETRSTVWF